MIDDSHIWAVAERFKRMWRNYTKCWIILKLRHRVSIQVFLLIFMVTNKRKEIILVTS